MILIVLGKVVWGAVERCLGLCSKFEKPERRKQFVQSSFSTGHPCDVLPLHGGRLKDVWSGNDGHDVRTE